MSRGHGWEIKEQWCRLRKWTMKRRVRPRKVSDAYDENAFWFSGSNCEKYLVAFHGAENPRFDVVGDGGITSDGFDFRDGIGRGGLK